MLGGQPVRDGLHGLPLPGGSILLLLQHARDRVLERVEPRLPGRELLAWRRDRRFQRLDHSPAVHSVPVGQRPDGQAAGVGVTPDDREQRGPGRLAAPWAGRVIPWWLAVLARTQGGEGIFE